MVRLENVVKTYQTPRGPCPVRYAPRQGNGTRGNYLTGRVNALSGITLRIEKGQFVIIRGPSGSGKTTLLMTMATMCRPTSGTVWIEKANLYAQSRQARARFRAANIGFVFQMFYLVPYLNVIENVALAGGTVGNKNSTAQAQELIERFGLADRAYHKPSQLSAGEKQRAAIARALLNRPRMILADEPTGNLDPDNAAAVLGYISNFHRQGGTVVLATHGLAANEYADRVICLQKGTVVTGAGQV